MASLFHYTTRTGLDGIVRTGLLLPSTAVSNPHDIRYGEGQYLTDLVPGSRTPAQLSRVLIGHPFQGSRFTHYVELEVSGLAIIQGRPHVYVVPNTRALDVSQRFIRTGVN